MLRNQITKTLLVGVAAVLLAGTAGLQAQGTLFVKNNNVGILQANPTHPLHITAASGGPLEVATFENNSGAFFVLRDFSEATSWSVATAGGFMFLDYQQAAGFELLIDQSGNGVFLGTVSGGSSRAMKKNIEPVTAPREILETVADLPIAHWSYKTEDTRHVGPMAEDFYAAFGLGADDKHIAAADAAGVALGAIQGLYDVVQEKDGTIQDLQQRVSELESLITQLLER